MRQLRYTKALEQLLHQPIITTAEAQKQGIPRHVLAHMVKTGALERLYPGGYRSVSYEPQVEFQWEHLAFIAASVSGGVICLISALCYYDLTDQVMREAWIAVPHHSYPPKRPHTRIIRMRNMQLGQEEMMLGEYRVRIFDRERCVVDAFRCLSHEVAIKALQRYLQGKTYKPQLKKLTEYAKKLRVNIAPYILAYTT